LEGFLFIGIEKERAYFDIAKQRVENEYALAV
jgi:DNA modification methylase